MKKFKYKSNYEPHQLEERFWEKKSQLEEFKKKFPKEYYLNLFKKKK